MLYNCLIHKRLHILQEIFFFFLKVVKRLCERHRVHVCIFLESISVLMVL